MRKDYILKLLLFSVIYFLLAKAGLALALDGDFASPVWLGSGIALCLLLIKGNAFWPSIAIGAFAVNYYSGSTFVFASIVAFGNTLEAILAYKIINRLQSQHNLFTKLKSVFVFLFASAVASIVSAFFGVLASYFFHSPNTNVIETFFTWWIGDFTSLLLIVPLVFLFNIEAIKEFKNNYSIISILILILACIQTFLVRYDSKVLPVILQYALVLFPIIISLTQSRVSTILHVLIIDTFAVVSTYLGRGPFVANDLNTNLIFLQSFIAALTFVCLIISVAIKEKQLVEQQLSETLAEKEMLISEIHHRIKNNLAMVSSLIFLQSETIENEQIKRKIDQTNLRIKTIALVHEHLYATNNVGNVEFSGYIERLSKMTQDVFENEVKISLKTQKINLPIEIAQPLGLIINELLTNSFKHAFTKTENAQINISFNENNGRYHLVYKDNGIGFEDNRISETLGLSLIDALAQQIEASYILKNAGGVFYEFKF